MPGGVFDEKKNWSFVSTEIVPEVPLKKNVYLCSSTFYLEPIEELIKPLDYQGLVIITGSESRFYFVSKTHEKLLAKITTKLPNNHRRGGQSQARIGRLRDEAIHRYLITLVEKATELFTKNGLAIVDTLILVGNAELKEKVKTLLKINVETVTITTSGAFNIPELRLMPIFNECLETDKSKKVVSEFEELVAIGSDKIVYGPEETVQMLEKKLISKVIIHKDFENKVQITSAKVYTTTSELIRSFGGIVGILYYNSIYDEATE